MLSMYGLRHRVAAVGVKGLQLGAKSLLAKHAPNRGMTKLTPAER